MYPDSPLVSPRVVVVLLDSRGLGKQEWHSELRWVPETAWNHWCLEGELIRIPVWVFVFIFSTFHSSRKCTSNLTATALAPWRNLRLLWQFRALVCLDLSLDLPSPIPSLLSPPLHSTGYDLSAKALNNLFNRFAKKRKYMNLDDFASCLSRVKIMDGELLVALRQLQEYWCFVVFLLDTYKKMSRGGASVNLSKDEVTYQLTDMFSSDKLLVTN